MGTHACESCGREKKVMIAMTPGRDKQPWQLCGRCWLEGLEPMKLGNVIAPERELPAVGSHAGTSLVTGARYTYTDQEINLRTGERKPRARP